MLYDYKVGVLGWMICLLLGWVVWEDDEEEEEGWMME